MRRVAFSAPLVLTLRQRIADLRGRGVYAGWPDSNQTIFIHVPKTGGSSVAAALGIGVSRHVPWTEYVRANSGKFRRYFKFAFVRNPWDRLVSSYTFLKQGGMNADDAAFAERHLARFTDFGDFVRHGLREDAIRRWIHFRPQTAFVCREDGSCVLDFVGRFESIRHDFGKIASRSGLAVELSLTNRSHRYDYRRYYDDDTAEGVALHYAADACAFGYRFDDAARSSG